MNRVFLAGARSDDRSALRLLLEELHMQVVGDSTGWSGVISLGPTTHPDTVAVDWGLVSTRSVVALKELRIAFPTAVLIILPSMMDPVERSKLIAETGEFPNKGPSHNQFSGAIVSPPIKPT
jgi:DNA-binding NarL/FixJ family response regulator